MKNTLMHIISIVLRIVYIPFTLCRQKNKVVMITRQADSATLDIRLLEDRISTIDKGIEIVILAKKLDNKLSYAFHMIRQMYHLATAKVVVIDGYCIAVSLLHHKKGTVVIQLWHALGAVKKFGHQILDMEEGSSRSTARLMKMHENYDIVLCASKATSRYYAEAFNVSNETVKVWGMPRVDYLLEKTEVDQSLYSEYPNLLDRKTILYVPTFRKNKTLDFDNIINQVDTKKYNFIIKAHPLDQAKINKNYLVDNRFTTYDLMKIADYIITDYSAVSIEASLLDKPLFFYTFDLEEYKKSRGLNIDIEKEMAGAVSSDICEIVEWIDKGDYDFQQLDRFKHKYVETVDIDNTAEISKQIINMVQREQQVEKN